MAGRGRPRKAMGETTGARVAKALKDGGPDAAVSLWIKGHVEHVFPLTSALHAQYENHSPGALVGIYRAGTVAADVDADIKAWHKDARGIRKTQELERKMEAIQSALERTVKAIGEESEVGSRVADLDRRMDRIEKSLQVRLTQTIVMTEVCRSEPSETKLTIFNGWLRAMDMSDDWWLAHGDIHSVAEWRLALLQMANQSARPPRAGQAHAEIEDEREDSEATEKC